MRPPLEAALAAALLSLALALPAWGEGYRHNRHDYASFRDARAATGDAAPLLEPNYLPFMSWLVPVAKPGLRGKLPRWLGGHEPERWLVYCHWGPAQMPLAVWIEEPVLVEDEDDLDPDPPEAYTAAIERALSVWERDLDGVVSFRRVADPDEADLRIRLRPEARVLDDEEGLVLGSARVRDACRHTGGDPRSGRIEVRYRVERLEVALSDDHGLLLPDQVEKLALHEIGHALGMPGHSPIPADLLFPIARDRIPREGLGAADVNSFLSLYALPSGTVYRRLDEPQAEAPARIGPEPRLALAPHVDSRLGFEMQALEGWTRIASPYGLVLVDGVAWDFEASFQVVVRRFDTVEEYLARHAAGHVRDSTLVRRGTIEIAGRPAQHVVLITRHDTVEELSFVASGDGRVLIVIAECPAEEHPAFSRWFGAARDSIEFASVGDAGRDYGPQ